MDICTPAFQKGPFPHKQHQVTTTPSGHQEQAATGGSHCGSRVPSDTHLVPGARSVLGGADHQVHAAALTRPVQMRSDGEHGSGAPTAASQPDRGEHPIRHLDVALQPHSCPESVGSATGSEPCQRTEDRGPRTGSCSEEATTRARALKAATRLARR